MKAETSSGAVYPEVSPEPVGQRGIGGTKGYRPIPIASASAMIRPIRFPFQSLSSMTPARYELLLHWLEVLKSK